MRSLRAARACLLALATIGGTGCATAPRPRPASPPPSAATDTARARPPQAPARALTWTPELSPPRRDSTGRVTWAPRPEPLPTIAFELRATISRATTAAETTRAWETLARERTLAGYAARLLARQALERGDSTRADSLWGVVASSGSIWSWEALRARADLALARGETARADSLLEPADRRGWPDIERAAWLVRRARIRLALRDTARAAELCRQAMRRYPSASPTSQALALLESIAAARGGALASDDERAAAEVDLLRLDRDSAIRRLRSVAGRRVDPERWPATLRLGEVLRRARNPAEGLRVLEAACRDAPSDADRARCRLERARALRDAGSFEAAVREFALAAGASPDTGTRETAWWERAQEEENRGHWDRARADYANVIAAGGRRRDDAELRMGLLWLAEGRRDRAVEAWEKGDGEPVRFWRAVVLRAGRPAPSDTLLEAIAALPGYAFYRAAARETLGRGGWPGLVAGDSCPAAAACEALDLAHGLLASGARDEALQLVSRWSARDPRLEDGGSVALDPGACLRAARIAYAAGRLPTGIRLARLVETIPDVIDDTRWGMAPWLYPPAFDTLYAAFPESASATSIDRALLLALTWQESKFDPRARSRSNAIGLTQLKQSTAAEVARRLGDPEPTEHALENPATNLRYGAAYLARMRARFGSMAAALAAYNAGPSTIAAHARTLIDHGGDALLAELVSFPDTRDYVKRILGMRQAYRQLRPARGP